MRALSLIAMTLVLATGEAQAEKPLTLTGTIREVAGGAAGRSAAEIKTDDGRALTLRGHTAADDDEIKRLGGMKVRVFATEGDPGLPQGYLRVERYEIVDVGGSVPRIGMLAEIEIEGQKRLIFVADDGTADLLPEGWLKKMAKHVGAKMWMIGTRGRTGFQPAKHGILRPGPKAEREEGPAKTEE
jgi:hypothetical protein